MSGFVKLFNSILHSTIWSEPDHVRIVWITMLAMSNRYGDVEASVPGLARMAGKSLDETEDAIARFLSPDSYSRTPDNEGRRIKTIVGGWNLLNHGKYRELLSAEERKEYNRRKQAERRAKLANPKPDVSMTVNDKSAMSTHTEAEAEAEFHLKSLEHSLHNPLPVKVQNSPLQIRLGKLLGRRPSTKWSNDEGKLLKQIGTPDEEDLILMERFYAADIPKDSDFRRTSMERLLKHWNGENDKAREWCRMNP